MLVALIVGGWGIAQVLLQAWLHKSHEAVASDTKNLVIEVRGMVNGDLAQARRRIAELEAGQR